MVRVAEGTSRVGTARCAVASCVDIRVKAGRLNKGSKVTVRSNTTDGDNDH